MGNGVGNRKQVKQGRLLNWLRVTLNMIMDYTPKTKQHRLGGMQKKKTLKVYTIFSAISWKTLWTARSFRVAANVQPALRRAGNRITKVQNLFKCKIEIQNLNHFRQPTYCLCNVVRSWRVNLKTWHI